MSYNRTKLRRVMEMQEFAQTHGFCVTPNGGWSRIVTPNDYLILFNALHDLLEIYDHRGNWAVAEINRLAEIRSLVADGGAGKPPGARSGPGKGD